MDPLSLNSKFCDRVTKLPKNMKIFIQWKNFNKKETNSSNKKNSSKKRKVRRFSEIYWCFFCCLKANRDRSCWRTFLEWISFFEENFEQNLLIFRRKFEQNLLMFFEGNFEQNLLIFEGNFEQILLIFWGKFWANFAHFSKKILSKICSFFSRKIYSSFRIKAKFTHFFKTSQKIICKTIALRL